MTTLKILAQLHNPVLPSTIGGAGNSGTSGGGTALGGIISGVIGALFVAGFLLTVVMLITGGILWISAGGDKAKLELARDRITNSIIGIIIVASTWAISTLVANFFGLNLESLSFPSIAP